MRRPLDIVVIGLTLSSSWGNGHATTYRALLRGLAEEGDRVLFLEREAPWYAGNRDLTGPGFCELALYNDFAELEARFVERLASADAVIVGSYVPDGADVLDLVLDQAFGVVGFYDIDTPVTLTALDAGRATYIRPDQIPLLDAYWSFSGGRSLDRLGKRYGAANPLPLYCSVDQSHYRPSGGPQRWDLGYLGTYSPDRQPALERFLVEPARRLPHRRFVVAGPQYPNDIAWPANVERIDHVPPADHPAFYAAQRFTLNVTRADMVAAGWSPSVRLFEAAACGTPIISDRWDGLDELLPDGRAILIADDTNDVVEALEMTSDMSRRCLAAAARSIVLDAHTGRARAAELRRDILATLNLKSPVPPAAAARPQSMGDRHGRDDATPKRQA
jgi:spore maturation protein CgeB